MKRGFQMTETKKDYEVRKIDIEELQEDLELLIWQTGIEKFKINETFPKSGTKEMIVEGLHIDIEGEIACCYDLNDDILKNEYVIMGFFYNNVTITRCSSTEYELTFPDGKVIIKGVVNH
jgi:hypothetical protein